MKFYDSEGREYEAVENYESINNHLLIRPVKQEPKWAIFTDTSGTDTSSNIRSIEINLTGVSEDQAQLIKESVQSLMEYIMGESRVVKAEEARHFMRENN